MRSLIAKTQQVKMPVAQCPRW